MSQAQAATGPDRLPWLADEPPPPRKGRISREVAGWIVAVTLLVFAGAYWIGIQISDRSAHEASAAQPSTTVAPAAANLAEPKGDRKGVER